MMKKVVVVGVVVALAAGGYYFANQEASKQAKLEIDKQLAQFEQQTGAVVDYENITANVFTDSVTMEKVSVKDMFDSGVAQISSVTVEGFKPNEISEHSRIDINHLVFEGDLVEQAPYLKEQAFDIQSEFNYDPDNGNADVSSALNVGNIANITFDFDMSNSQDLMAVSQKYSQTPPDFENMTFQQQLAIQSEWFTSMSEIVPKSLSFKVNNNGELRSVMESLVAEQGMTYDQFEQTLTQQLAMSPMPEQLRSAVQGFVQGNEHFEVKLSLPEGKKVAEINQQLMMLMGQPEELAKFFNLEASGK